MDFPTIHTNFWDAVMAVPSVMIITQIIKVLLKVQKKFVPTIALIIGLIISIFISHRDNLVTGIFMGWFYGYAAIGSYASLKTTIIAFRNGKRRKYVSGRGWNN
jgi:cell shape-determining protein MreD